MTSATSDTGKKVQKQTQKTFISKNINNSSYKTKDLMINPMSRRSNTS
jgi:hypothetical protein